MKRIQWTFFVLSGIVATTVILSAQLWISTGSGVSTTGTISTSSGLTSALSVAGGGAFGGALNVGGTIQAGSGDVNITNSTGNLLPAALASGTISTAQTFTAPMTLQASTPHIFVAPSGLTLAQLRGRVSDDAGSLQFVNNAGTTEQARLTWTNTPALTISGGAGGTTGIIVGNTAVSWAGVRLNTSASQPGFLAYNSANDALVSMIDFDAEVYDTGSNFASDTFTAPVTGVYHLCTSVAFSSGGGTPTGAILTIVTSNGSYSFRDAYAANSTLSSVGGCISVDMDASDTALVTLSVGGTSPTVAGTGVAQETFFSGRLVP